MERDFARTLDALSSPQHRQAAEQRRAEANAALEAWARPEYEKGRITEMARNLWEGLPASLKEQTRHPETLPYRPRPIPQELRLAPGSWVLLPSSEGEEGDPKRKKAPLSPPPRWRHAIFLDYDSRDEAIGFVLYQEKWWGATDPVCRAVPMRQLRE